MLWLKSPNELIIDIYVQPSAKVTQIIGVHGDRLKIKIAAQPTDNAANCQVCELIAKLCMVSKNQVKITSGQKSRLKRVSIMDNCLAAELKLKELIDEFITN